jgi:DNA helicase II / ATP-dependent DNA helicase PcrA
MLNQNQKEAVSTLSGPLLVLAGAGTGKTRVITYRIANLIRHGTPPERILGMTFTNKAANEMKERIGAMLSSPPESKKAKRRITSQESRPQLSTFHSLCVQILRRHIEALGYPKTFAIYSQGDQESLARQVLREIRYSEQMLAPSQMLFCISQWKSKSLTPVQAKLKSENDAQHLASIAYARYQQALKLKGCVDFDDLLLLTESLFQQHESIRQQEANRFDHILVDEYQDTNQSQYRIVRALAGEHRNLCVVGDDDQSIYAWRGAEVEHILSFHKDWPDAKVIRLEENYRSTQAIIEHANTLIRFNKLRNDKKLIAARPGGEKPKILQFPDETLEAAETVRSIRNRMEAHHRQPGDFAILFRTNEQPRPFETELRKQKIPYILIGGMSFFDRKEVKDVLAYLRLLEDEPDEISILRIINTPARGLGKQSVEQLIEHSIKQKVPLWKLVTGEVSRPPLNAAACKGLAELSELARVAKQKVHQLSLVDLVRHMIRASRYRTEIERNYPDPDDREVRWNTVEQIVNSLAQYEKESRRPTLTDFLDKLLLGEQDANDEKEKQLQKNAVALMTLHAAKGLEFPEVYMVGLEEGILPHHRSLENDEAGVDEERRLCYVGVTRAEERLTLSMSLTRMKWGKPRETRPSRFLYELTNQADHPDYAPNTPYPQGAQSASRRSATQTPQSKKVAKKATATKAVSGSEKPKFRRP